MIVSCWLWIFRNYKMKGQQLSYTLIIIIYTNLVSPYPACFHLPNPDIGSESSAAVTQGPTAVRCSAAFPTMGSRICGVVVLGEIPYFEEMWVCMFIIYTCTHILHLYIQNTCAHMYVYIYMSVCNMSSWKCSYIYIAQSCAHRYTMVYLYILIIYISTYGSSLRNVMDSNQTYGTFHHQTRPDRISPTIPAKKKVLLAVNYWSTIQAWYPIYLSWQISRYFGSQLDPISQYTETACFFHILHWWSMS